MKTIISIIDNYKVIYENYNNENELNFINNNIKKVYVINLKSNFLRRNYIKLLMKKYKINYTLIIVDKIDDKINNLLNINKSISKSELGCLLSHLWCLTNIINNKFKNAIIFEDDVIFHKNFLKIFSSIYSENLDLLLLGACDFNFASVHQFLVKNNKYTIDENSKKVYGSHANYYSLRGAQKMLNLHLNNPTIAFFDKLYPQLFEYFNKFQSSFICYPNLVLSDISTSNLNHNYSYFSLSEINYYKKCFVNINFKDYHYFNLCLLEQKYEIKPNETIESYINRILYSLFYNQEKIDIIKNRLSFNFFSCDDLKYIMNI